MSSKSAYEQKLKAQLDEWNAEIEQLKAKAEQASADAQLEYYRKIEELRERQQEANSKLLEMKDASGQAWEDLKLGAEAAWEALSTSIKSARERFK
ncbi:coiled coil domain-containing protein [Terasakiispira papahanaumokuakeensis]|uniref:Coiled coil domain-containing protein n=1 Tax=Terasakiispira papahanaumokuakeensis TaxID=197479 RepID=A0A1E2V7G2_9GAMM|nr:coiled coil domain-containing protein [Terasakiispira papahanaumokuakeensis]ODC02792.1 coiled coil domain-containing protein [Terasakiispira papahanaumokuakeensis]